MKNVAKIIALTLAAAVGAHAGPMVDNGNKYYETPPSRYEGAGVSGSVSPQWLIEFAGWAPASKERIAAERASAAEAQATAAQYADPQPAVFVPRVSGSITNIVGTSQVFADADTGELFSLDETGSPEHTHAKKEAQKAARDQKKASLKAAVSAAKTDKDKLDAVVKYIESL